MTAQRRGWRRWWRWALLAPPLLLLLATIASQRALPDALDLAVESAGSIAVADRDGQLLRRDYDGGWNLHERVALTQMPLLLREAFVAAEDRRYWQHHGIDWRARLAALKQNLQARRAVRGASTLSEQVVRLLHPRPRTVWSRWVEGWEAMRLEARFEKAEILEFYLNQVPFGGNRRGVLPAARQHFGRSLDTLSSQEMLALAVLVRAPSRLAADAQALHGGVLRLAQALQAQGRLSADEVAVLSEQPLQLARLRPQPRAAHFVREVERQALEAGRSREGLQRSSLDAALQAQAESYLQDRLRDLAREGARQGAVLVVELPENRVRAWAVGDIEHEGVVGIDAVRTPRQPGSTLKPLLYAMTLERGWNVNTVIDDAELSERVNSGLHQYRNYSRQHYGAVSLREALGNSLNIPALKALQFVGGADFLQRLRLLGIDNLREHPNVYGDGLALGNGEISLYELVQAYTALANDGRWLPLTLFEEPQPRTAHRGFESAAAHAINAILSDPGARQLEFGDGGTLRFPQATAVKTGTSGDYRDAWTVAYTGRHLVGVWIGNLSGRETEGITGARGPALLTRSLLAALTPVTTTLPLATGNDPAPAAVVAAEDPRVLPEQPRLLQPFNGLQLALDPRIPDALQAFEFQLLWRETPTQVRWIVDDQTVAVGESLRWAWPLQRGIHRARAEVVASDGLTHHLPEVSFRVQ